MSTCSLSTLAKSYYLLVAFLVACNTLSFSQPGTLDPSFGALGKISFAASDSGSYIQSIALQQDGKMILAGFTYHQYNRILLVRLLSNGIPDSSFGIDGVVLTAIPFRTCWANTTIVQQDGKIVVGGFISESPGSSYNSFLLMRYHSSGLIDSSFGQSGLSTLTFANSFAAIQSIVLKPDGKILAGGQATFPLNAHDFVIAQFNNNGKLDSTFGMNGKTVINLIGDDNIKRILIRPGGKILAGGFSTVFTGTRNNYFSIVQCLADGRIDSSFGQNGFITDYVSNGKNDAYDIAVLQDKKILMAGTALDNSIDKFAVIRYDSSGRTDSSFGVAGMATSMIETNYNAASNVFSLPGGKILLTGFSRNDLSMYNFSMIRLLSDGIVDSSFGVNGGVVTDFNGSNDFSRSAVLQSDGKVVLAGITDGATYSHLAIARYKEDNVLSSTLSYFTARKKRGQNVLSWQPDAGSNVAYYIVERSNSGNYFKELMIIPSTASINTYTDIAFRKGVNYYRLKVISKDNRINYSEVKLIDNSSSVSISIYPNPAHDHLQLQVNTDNKIGLEIQLVNSSGKVLSTYSVNAQPGIETKTIDITKLAKGSYFLLLISNNKKEFAMKFEKM